MASKSHKRHHRTKLPRKVPLGVKLAVIFHNYYLIPGTLVLLVGLVAIFGIGQYFYVNHIVIFRNSDPHTKGVVVDMAKMKSKTRRSTRSITLFPTYEYTVKYNVNGKDYLSNSYSEFKKVKLNDTVDVKYKDRNPQVSKIAGMRRSRLPIWIVLVLIFPVFGIYLLRMGIKPLKRYFRVLKNGIYTRGAINYKTPTGMEISKHGVKRRVYRVSFTFSTIDGIQVTSSMETAYPELVEDEEKERLIYDPADPYEALLIDALPKPLKQFLENSRK